MAVWEELWPLAARIGDGVSLAELILPQRIGHARSLIRCRALMPFPLGPPGGSEAAGEGFDIVDGA